MPYDARRGRGGNHRFSLRAELVLRGGSSPPSSSDLLAASSTVSCYRGGVSRPVLASLSWESRPSSELVRLAWPMALSFLSLSVMTLVDTLFIGQLGAVPLAAVGIGGPVVFTVASFGIAVFGAAKISVGQAQGRGDVARTHLLLGAFSKLALALGAGSAVVGLLVSLALPLFTDAGTETSLARDYVAVRSLGLPLALWATAIGQWRAARGDSHSAMRAALVANVANVPLNALFLFGFGWGVQGAALATVCSRVVELGWLLAIQRPEGLFWRSASSRDALACLRTGLATGTERVLDMIAFTSVPVLLSWVGAVEVAAHQIVLQIMLISFLPLFAVSESVSILIAQARGAERSDLTGRLARTGIGIALLWGALCGLGLITFAELLVAPFSDDRRIIEAAGSALLVAAALQFVNAGYNVQKGILRGFSAFRLVALVTIACAWVITPALTYFFLAIYHGLGVVGAWWALCIEVSVGAAVLAVNVARRLDRTAVVVDSGRSVRAPS